MVKKLGKYQNDVIQAIRIDELIDVTEDLQQQINEGGSAATAIAAHNHSPTAHPELSAFITEEADRAEVAADVAMAAGWVYPTKAAGEAVRSDGEYFWVVSADDANVLDLYLMGASTATETEKSTPSSAAVGSAVSGLNDFKADLSDSGLFKYTGAGGTIPIVTDSGGRVLIGVDSFSGDLVAKGLISQGQVEIITKALLDGYGVNAYTGSGPVYPILSDYKGAVLIGYDAENNKIVGAITESSSNQNPYTFAAKNINHMLFYGQSLSIGTTATTILSTSQPYSNITFAGGPRAWNGSSFDFSPPKPLVEDAVNPAPDGGTNRGETPCSGAANYASISAAENNGIIPSDYVILASAAGRGSYTISQLKKGSSWYENTMLPHISEGKALDIDYALHVVCWVQGETDANSSTQTPYETYKSELSQLRSDINSDARLISGQSHNVHMLTYQTSARVGSWPDVALAQLDAARESEYIHFVTPCYHFPFNGDALHMTEVGYKWMGAYFGRAYQQLVFDNRKPDSIVPISAVRNGLIVTLKFKVPQSPLVLDVSSIASTTDKGFKVVDSVGAVSISSIDVGVDGKSVVLTLATEPVGAAVVRYALDYLGTGLNIENGASGNLRDSTSSVIEIAGDDRPLYHVAPHFYLNVVNNAGI